ncbi:response regulator [Sphingomonas bacterium]|uniref:response regulator n=1 Tax=Sphingomonas bacterium TaxID=1895847 RepID=UPI0020C6088B|nr:response regulator [Sphingomonas bacterium]
MPNIDTSTDTGAATMIPVLLVVEDEPLLRMLAMDVGEDAGFTVVAAANAAAAVAILEARTDIRVVFTDIDMPGSIDGLKLAACIRDRWPPIHIIVTSGHRKPADGDLPAGSMFFAKPYRQDRVIEAMRRMAA